MSQNVSAPGTTERACPSRIDESSKEMPARRAYVAVVLVVSVCTAVNWALAAWLAPTNLAMVYLLGVVLIAVRCPPAPSIVCALASILAFDFLFVPPVFTLRFGDTQYLITGLALLLVGSVVSTLASRARSASRSAALAHEERLRNSLLASLSHDLRTPLAVIAGSASNLRDNGEKLSEAERSQLLETLYEETQHVSLVVTDLLEMTRFNAGRVALNRQWYPAEELVGAALERCKPRLSGHRIRTRLAKDLPMLRVDGVLLEKLLVNLIENAVKYTPVGTLITVSAEQAGDRIVLSVEDEGPGFAPDVAGLLFEKFFRANPEGAPGSGLGLSICRAIAELHDGRIEARNRSEGGAIFALSLRAESQPVSEAS
jgi:two-component system, OmpR family, sensor histidine kinase KdpD